MKTLSTAILIETSDRKNLSVSAVAVTEVPNRGLVLRFGAEIGSLDEVVGHIFELPVIVSVRGWNAYSSAGFISVESSLPRQTVIGIQGLPWMGKKSLRLLGEPMEVVVFSSGARIKKIDTHGIGKNSNPAAAAAANLALEIMAQIDPLRVIISEGQSDYTVAWEVRALPSSDEHAEPVIEWPTEHRLDRFSDKEITEKVLRCRSMYKNEDYEWVLDEQRLACRINDLAAAAVDGSWRETLTQNCLPQAYWPAIESGFAAYQAELEARKVSLFEGANGPGEWEKISETVWEKDLPDGRRLRIESDEAPTQGTNRGKMSWVVRERPLNQRRW